MREQTSKLALLWPAVVLHAVLTLLLAWVWHHSKLLFAVLALIPVALLAQNPAPTAHYSDQTELSKAEEWVLSQGAAESIAPELAAILGVGSDRLPVKLKSYRMSDGISLAFAVSTNPKQEGIVLSALKTIADKMKIYSVGTAWPLLRNLGLPLPPSLRHLLPERLRHLGKGNKEPSDKSSKPTQVIL
ncbi:MAG: hypothetical protein DME55_12055 [Verrucomicrobia bacterium]|nr:MAG: hypothetical protein DME55_12055 [Verrucomicrobiota bacterium]